MSDLSWRPDLHERLARRDDRRTRAFRGAAAAALVAAVGWFADLALAWHVGTVMLAALAAASWPVRQSVLEAFRTIADQAGLAYQTHVEYRGRDDPFGLLQAAETQARLSVRGVVPPQRSAWWLPLASLAVALVLLTAFTGGPASWLRGAGPSDAGVSGAPPPTPPAALAPEAPREQPDDPDASEAIEPPSAAGQPDAPPGADDRGDGGGGDDAADGGDGAGGLEREALDRFLDSLRERPRADDRSGSLGDAERDGVRDDADADMASAEVRGDLEEAMDDRDRTPDGRGDETGEGERSVELPAGGGEADDAGDEAADRDEDGADGTGAGPDPDAEQGDDGAADAGEQPSEVPAGSAEGAPDEEGVAGMGAEQPELDAGMGDEAGIGPGAPIGQDDQAPPPGGDLEALPGMIGPGPETLGGRVRLPGRDSDLAPTPSAAERFERAVEQAVTDGSVPVTFQEIIRNYFR